MRTLADLGGVSRSTVYAHWESAADANDDLVRHAATWRPGWQRRLLDAPPAADLALSIDGAVADLRTELGVVARAVAAANPTDRRLADELARWEGSWLEAFAAWLDHHLAARGRAFIVGGKRAAAVTLTAMIEGSLLLEPLRPRELPVERTSRLRPGLASVCARVIELLSESATTSRATSALENLPGSPRGCSSTRSPAARAILHRICDELESDPAVAGAALLGRHVDLARLARRLEITERRLYAIWPTPESFNSALAGAIAAQDQREMQQLSTEALESAIAEGSGLTENDIIALNQRVVVEGHRRRPSKLGVYALSAFEDASVERLRRVVDGNQLDTPMVLALLALLDRRPDPAHSPRDIITLLTNATAGLQRMVATQPALEHEVVHTPFGQAPILGWSVASAMLALSTGG